MPVLNAELVLWFVVPGLAALGAASLVWLLAQARMQVLVATFQAAVSKMQSEFGAARPGVETLLSELHTERRRFMRRLPGAKGLETTVITQERIYLRNLPLTAWMQDELCLGTGEELDGACTSIPLLPQSTTHTIP